MSEKQTKTTNIFISPSQTSIDVNKKVKDYNHNNLFDYFF